MARNMLITRCPDCQTSFRITFDMLQKADGRVRCGRCETVFSAFNSLADSRTDLRALGAEDVTLESAPPARKVAIGAKRTVPVVGRAAQTDTATEAVVDTDLISAREVEDVLTSTEEPEPGPPWTMTPRLSSTGARRAWAIAFGAAVFVLLAQLAHHFRAPLAGAPLVGPPLTALYERLGMTVEPAVDPSDYEIVNWVATASTAAGDDSTLQISAGIHNRSGETKPMPLLFLQLTDRFDNAIGARYFEPAEYLGPSSGAPMLQPGTTATAHLELVDPGPQAYGFEVDICVRLEGAALRCKADTVLE